MNERETQRTDELEEQIHSKEVELQKHYSQMGKDLLTMAEGEQRIINGLVDEIIAARTELSALKGQRECPHCLGYNDAGSYYCKRCGRQLSAAKEEKETAI